MAGALFVVATPIGNLEDLSFRALRTLREVDVIAAEDTRHTLKLLTHYEIRKPLVSLREHNEHRETPRLVARIERGESIALVTDAGTPGIADPGARLVRGVREAGLVVEPIPGPSAVTAALSVAGLPETEFVFLGFSPARRSERSAWFERLGGEPRAVVFFEAPHRIADALSLAGQYLAERQIDVVKEISKINYKLVKQSSIMFERNLVAAGEFVVVVHPAGQRPISDETAARAHKLFGYLTDNGLLRGDIAINAVASELSISPDSARKAVRAGRKLAKRHKFAGP